MNAYYTLLFTITLRSLSSSLYKSAFQPPAIHIFWRILLYNYTSMEHSLWNILYYKRFTTVFALQMLLNLDAFKHCRDTK